MIIVISGASRGIGLALTRAYVSTGDRVFALCRNPADARDLADLAGRHDNLTILRADVSDPASVAGVKQALGDTPVDTLFNVAGTINMEGRPEDIDLDSWAGAFDVMVTGPFRMTLALLPNIAAAHGRIVNISSQVGASDWQPGGLYSYGAAKAGLNRAMKSLATDLRDRGVTVALVHPGHVKTDMGGPDGEITPEESARGIKAVTDALTLDGTGRFYDWNGSERHW